MFSRPAYCVENSRPQAADQLTSAVAYAFSGARAGQWPPTIFYVQKPPGIAPARSADLLGIVAGLGPPIIRSGCEIHRFPYAAWLGMILNALLLLIPGFVRLRGFQAARARYPRSAEAHARYLLVQRGFLILLCFVSFGLTLLFAASLAHLPLAIERTTPPAPPWARCSAQRVVGRLARSHAGKRENRPRFLSQRLRRPGDLGEPGGNLAHGRESRGAGACLETSSKGAPAGILVVYLAIDNDQLGAAAGVAPPSSNDSPHFAAAA